MSFFAPPSTPAVGDHCRWRNYFLVLLIAATAWRLLFVFIAPLDLVPDEAYYWDWGRRPALGYYSKPPLIAWINTLSSAIFGAAPSAPYAVRIPAVFFGAVALSILYVFASRLFNRQVGFWTAVLTAFVPATCALNFLMTIDAPLVCSWVAALYSLWRAVEKKDSNKGWWLLTAFFCGLGLLSKQMMLVFPLLMLIFLLFSPEDRFRLKTPWPYLTICIALFFLLPPLVWNMGNDWITLQHTAGHFDGNRSFFDFLKTSSEFIGGQLLLMSPLPVILFACLAAVFIKKIKSLDRRIRLLFIFSALPLLGFVLMSFRQRMNANWPAVFYPAGFLLVAAWAMESISAGKRMDSRRRLFPAAVYSGLGLTFLTYGLVFIFSFISLGGGKFDPLVRLKGWRQLGSQISSLLTQLPDPEQVFLLADKRQTVSEMAFYVSGQPGVYLWNGGINLIGSQYDLWPGPEDKIGWDALIVLSHDHQPDKRLGSLFGRIMPLTTLEVPLGPAGSRKFSVYLGLDLEKWPQ